MSARAFVREVLAAWGEDELIPDAVLLVDELVVNALAHVDHGPIQIDLRSDEMAIRVDVSDPEPDFADDRWRPLDAMPRIGLRIVDTVASRWGVDTSPGGKSVWFELDHVEARPVLAGSAGDR